MPERVSGDGRWFLPSVKREAPELIEQWAELFATFVRRWGGV